MQQTSALDELARDPSSRKRFLRTVGATAVAAGLSAALAACGKSKSTTNPANLGPLAQYGPGDLGVLNYALTLEYIETSFYTAALRTGRVTGRTAKLFNQFNAEESAHIGVLTAAVRKLGGKPPTAPKTIFPLDTQEMILSTASQLETVGAGAYLGQLDVIQSKSVLATALSIHTVEGRHAATLNQLLGHSPTPDGAFGRPITATDVQRQIQTFLGA